MSAKTTKRAVKKPAATTRAAKKTSAVKTKKADKQPKKNSSQLSKAAKNNKQDASTKVPAVKVLMLSSVVMGTIILLGAALLWYSKIYTSPERIFWDTIDNNLSVNSVTRQVTQSDGATESNEIDQLVFGVDKGVNIHKTITQQSQGTGPTVITVEGVGTPTDDYQRYSNISRTIDNGKKPDYSKLSKLWVHNGNSGEGSSEPQLYGQTLLGAVFFANLPPQQRQEIVSYIRSHNAYTPMLDSVKRHNNHGHPEYVYTVSISLKGLTSSLREYGQKMGIKNALAINPNNYSVSDKIEVEMTIDSHSRQLKTVTYKNSSVKELYTAYGVAGSVVTPGSSISSKTFGDLLTQLEK